MLKIELDETDIRILNVLQSDSGLSNVDLAARIGLSPSPCLARVRALERSGVILQKVALLDASLLGANAIVFVQITLEKQTETLLAEFEAAMQRLPEVMECYLMSGDSDYLLRVVVQDIGAFREFIIDRLTKIPGVVNIRSSFALKQAKYKTAIPLEQLQRSGRQHRR